MRPSHFNQLKMRRAFSPRSKLSRAPPHAEQHADKDTAPMAKVSNGDSRPHIQSPSIQDDRILIELRLYVPNRIRNVGSKMRNMLGSGHSKPSATAVQADSHHVNIVSSSNSVQTESIREDQEQEETSPLPTPEHVPIQGSPFDRPLPDHVKILDRAADDEAPMQSFRKSHRHTENDTCHDQVLNPTSTASNILEDHLGAETAPTGFTDVAGILVEAQQNLMSAAQAAKEKHHESWIVRYRFESISEQAYMATAKMGMKAASQERAWTPKDAMTLNREVQAAMSEIRHFNERLVEIMVDQQTRQDTLQLHLSRFCDLQQLANGLVEPGADQIGALTSPCSVPASPAEYVDEVCKSEGLVSEPCQKSSNRSTQQAPVDQGDPSVDCWKASSPDHSQEEWHQSCDRFEAVKIQRSDHLSRHGSSVSSLHPLSLPDLTIAANPTRPLCDPSIVKFDYAVARHDLEMAQWQFEHRDIAEHEMRKRLGPQMGQEAMDVHCVRHYAQLTRDLAQAEEKFKKARLDVIENQCEIDDSKASSIFADNKSDGYRSSVERMWMEHTAMPKLLINDWRHLVHSETDSPEVDIPQCELNSLEGELVPCDSASGVADPPYKAKIERWEKFSGALGRMPTVNGTSSGADEGP